MDATQLPREAWVSLLEADPRPWLLEAAAEPAARWLTLAALMDRPLDDPGLRCARSDVLADPGTAGLIQRLPDWEVDAVTTGHNSPTFAPNMLSLLWRMGLRGGDSPRVERLLDQMLEHRDSAGRFQTYARWRNQDDEPSWGALLCDTHAITEVLVRFGRGGDARVCPALQCMSDDLVETPQGLGWPCRPDDATGFRGPGRKADICPQVTVEALRALSCTAANGRTAVPAGDVALAAARTCCDVWLSRGTSKPYMFGHGRQFKTVKWPPMWYDVYALLDALSQYRPVWEGPGALPQHRRAVCELAACLVAYNFGPGGRVTPQSCYRGFESYSWGHKRAPSPFATALLCVILRRLTALSDEIAEVDVFQLPSSKGGSGKAVPPRRG